MRLSPVSSRLQTTLRLGFLLLACCCFFRTAFYGRPGFGLDPSWSLLLNYAFSEHLTFGSRIISNYGPLGFLEHRLPYGVNPLFYLGFDLLIFGVFLRVAMDVARLRVKGVLLAGAIAALFISKSLVSTTPSATLFCAILCLLARTFKEPHVFWSMVLSLSCAVMFFFKFNYAFIGVVLTMALTAYKGATGDRVWRHWLAILLGQAAFCLVVAGLLGVNPATYIESGVRLIKDYNDGMASALEMGLVPVQVVFALVTLFIGLWAAHFLAFGFGRESLFYFSWTGLVVFVLFKNAVVRSDIGHSFQFVYGLPVITLAWLMYAPRSTVGIWRGLWIAAVVFPAGQMIGDHGSRFGKLELKEFLPVNYFRELCGGKNQRTWGDYQRFVRQEHPDRVVPSDIVQRIGTNSVDVFPQECSLPLASGLNYTPRPSFQSYQTIGRYLESRNATFYTGVEAPAYVLLVNSGECAIVDMRPAVWDEPETLRLLQRHYAWEAVFTNAISAWATTTNVPVMLLKRKGTPKPLLRHDEGRLVARLNRPFDIPARSKDLYAEIHMRKRVSGRVISMALKTGPVWAQLYLEDGSREGCRAVPANMECGILVNRYVWDINSLMNYFGNRSPENKRVIRMTLQGRSLEYSPEIEVHFFTLQD